MARERKPSVKLLKKALVTLKKKRYGIKKGNKYSMAYGKFTTGELKTVANRIGWEIPKTNLYYRAAALR